MLLLKLNFNTFATTDDDDVRISKVERVLSVACKYFTYLIYSNNTKIHFGRLCIGRYSIKIILNLSDEWCHTLQLVYSSRLFVFIFNNQIKPTCHTGLLNRNRTCCSVYHRVQQCECGASLTHEYNFSMADWGTEKLSNNYLRNRMYQGDGELLNFIAFHHFFKFFLIHRLFFLNVYYPLES